MVLTRQVVRRETTIFVGSDTPGAGGAGGGITARYRGNLAVGVVAIGGGTGAALSGARGGAASPIAPGLP